jgi:hypothetical protein
MSSNSPNKKAIPPYLPYKTLVNFVDSLKIAMPQRIDRSLMSSMSGAVQSQLMASLEYLRLINPETGIPTEKLNQLARSGGDEKRRLLADILMSSYQFLFNNGLDLERATMDLLQERFRQTGTSGDTLRKAVAFFLKAAREAGMKLSPHLKRTYTRRMTGPRAKRKMNQIPEPQGAMPLIAKELEANSSQNLSIAKILSDKFPAFDPGWDEETRKSWFEGFKELIAQVKSEQEKG